MEESVLSSVRNELSSLDGKRKALEIEAEAIVSELTTPTIPSMTGEGNSSSTSTVPVIMGIDTPLVDKDGYPRSDIDVYRARTLRSRLAIIRTDHSTLMKQIEGLLLQLASLRKSSLKRNDDINDTKELEARRAKKPKPKFDPKTGKWVVMNWDGSMAGIKDGENRSFHNDNSEMKCNDANEIGCQSNNVIRQQEEDQQHIVEAFQNLQTTTTTTSNRSIPFARVNSVAPNSPSSSLQENDLIVQFGTITSINGNDLSSIGQLVVQAATNKASVEIHVLRNGQPITLSVSPQPWQGRGLLGCHIVNYSP